MVNIAYTWLVGAARCEIVFSETGIGMMGYGRSDNIIKGRATPLFSRAFCFVNQEGQASFFAQAELCMIFPEVKRAVIERLQIEHDKSVFNDKTVMITSQHTHSAPGGFSHFPFYNFSVPGFRPEIFNAVVSSLAEAIQQSWQRRQPATLKFTHGDFAEDQHVAFNRSLPAYNRNSDVSPLSTSETHRAIERTMWLLKAETADGKAIGQINWFGVHPTSVGNRNTLVSYDNKGYAAEAVEQALGPDTVAIFAQQFAGDVSPNAQGKGVPGWGRGPHKDEHENARFNGNLQATQALKLINQLEAEHQLSDGTIDSELIYRDLSNCESDEDFTDGIKGERTSAACHGLPFFGGSPVDGPGAPAPVLLLLKGLAHIWRWREWRNARQQGGEQLTAVQAKYKAQSPKLIVSESAIGRLLGLDSVQGLPSSLDPILKEMQQQERAGALIEKPWVPGVLPLHFMRIGELALIGFPGEITTQSGRQLRALCQQILSPLGVHHVVISSYANAYFGYCTTPAEYEEQLYEGGHTTFGKQTHNAFRTEYRKLLCECIKSPAQRLLNSDQPETFSAETLAKRSVI
ncbi:MAG: neutral/alkaline non-lysosomal ceramidase N-terminal domain-containing protein [Pseudomonadota bacterium]